MASEAVPIRSVSVTSPFWSRLQTCVREKVIPSMIETQKNLGHWTALTWKEGHELEPHPFWDSDTYKCLEAACYSLAKHHDDKLMATVEETVDMIRKAQHPDGYINSFYTVTGIQKRWTNLRDYHELYCLGHLFEATVAYEELTGSGRLLEVAIKAISHVASVFGRGPSQKPGYPGHEEIELALLRIYELTGHVPAFDLAEYFITERGRKDENGEIYYDHEARVRGGNPYDFLGPEFKPWYHGCRDYAYHQADSPLVDTDEVKGHAVRAMYYYTAATDLVRLSPPGTISETAKVEAALSRLWGDLIGNKMYVTGGVGSVAHNEGFGQGYLLSDLEAQGCYAETCAAFGLIVWCQRLLRLKLDSQYSDVMETTLYNGLLGALSVEGDGFYYQNVMKTTADKPKERSSWFGVACCPPNVAKLLGSIGSMIYTVNKEKTLVAIHLYIGSRIEVPGTDVIITQESSLPWSGKVFITVQGSIGLALRIPGWASSHTCSATGEFKDGYLYLSPSTDAQIELEFSMQPQKLYANPKTDKDEICLRRGPLIYCIEGVDNPGIDTDHIALTDAAVQDGARVSIGSLSDVITITTTAAELASQKWDRLYGLQPWQYKDTEKTITAIPYFLRANRSGNGAMRVWTKRLPSAGHSHMNGHA